MAYLLDTSFLIQAVFTKSAVARSVLDNLRGQRLSISIITIAELYEGAHHRVNPNVSLEAIRQEVAGFPGLPLTDEICLRFGKLRASLRRQGAPRPDFDLLIAATALHGDLTLRELIHRPIREKPSSDLS